MSTPPCQPSLLLSLQLSAGPSHFYLISYLLLPLLIHLEPLPRSSGPGVDGVGVSGCLLKPSGCTQNRTAACCFSYFGGSSWEQGFSFSGYCHVVKCDNQRHENKTQNIWRNNTAPLNSTANKPQTILFLIVTNRNFPSSKIK